MSFKWRLDRVLEIKRKDEQHKRALAAEIANKLVKSRNELTEKQQRLELLMRKISSERPLDKLQHQQLFIESSKADDSEIVNIKNIISEFERDQQRITKEIIEAKSFVERLEKLRQKAYEEYMTKQSKAEQNELDESFNIRLIKNMSELQV